MGTTPTTKHLSGSGTNYFSIPIIPENEQDRLRALRRYEILDTPPENAFNNIVKTCCMVFDVPIALVSFIDADRVFFKANEGMQGVNNVERGKSLCSLALLSDQVTVFEDAIKEPCLLSNPLVIGEFGLRFYAGAPLRTIDGYNIGSLCLVGKEPKELSEKDRAILENFASIVMDEVELRLSAIKAVRAKEELLDVSIEKNNELLKINNDLDNFVYTASHDLKAPITNIEGLLSALHGVLDKKEGDEELEAILKLVDVSIGKFKDTLHDLTEISKIQKNLQEDIEPVSISGVVDDVKILINDLIENTHTRIDVDTSICDVIRFSKINLQSIIFNLLSNSIKYRDEQRIPDVRIKTCFRENYTVLEVSDNGMGINSDNLQKIFTMFKRLHNHVEGNGVGLYLVKRIMDNSGGKIEVESVEGIGTKFRLFFKNN